MKQTNRKNKTKQSVNWPTSTYFTIIDLIKSNPNMLTASKSEITLRVRLAKAIEEGKIVELGAIPGGKGRPQKVFTHTPVSQVTLNKAIADKINLVDNARLLVNPSNTQVNLSCASVNPTPPTAVTR